MYSDEELLEKLKLLTWDTTLTAEDLLRILKSSDVQSRKLGLYIKILNWFPWHQVRHMVQSDKLHELLSEEVIRGLFPRDLRDKYRYVKSLL